MGTKLKFHICQTRLGWIGMLFSSSGLKATTLPEHSQCGALSQAIKLGGVEEISAEDIGHIPERLRSYTNGNLDTFDDIMDWGATTHFQKQVLKETQQIPSGETRSYGWVAKQIGAPRAARAVGRVMATNPWPIIIPCHRVVASDGSLRGYRGGNKMKLTLLNLERA